MNITSPLLKKMNYRLIFEEIHNSKKTSKSILVQKLKLSLPTISKVLEELEAQGFIMKSGFGNPSGGRPSTIYKFNERKKISIVVNLHLNYINIALVDLCYEIVSEKTVSLYFENNEEYFMALGATINNFISETCSDSGAVLGVDIAIPGIISENEENVIFSEILKTDNIKLSSFSEHIPYSCGFIHDAEASAIAELHCGRGFENAFYIMLNKYLCFSLILGGKLIKSKGLSSGTLEHLVIHENGRRCYCGKRGCAEAYCSALNLLQLSGRSSLDDFFIDLRKNDNTAKEVWDEYLSNLALVIDNARMVVGCDVVLCGFIQKYLINEDLELLKQKILEITTFKNADFSIQKGTYGDKAILLGTAIPRIKKFLTDFLD